MSDTPEPFDAARRSFLLGLACQQQGELEQAEDHYRESLRWLPGRPSTLTNLGATLVARGRAQEALPLLQQALQAEPDDVHTRSQLGLALTQLGRDAEALAAYTWVCDHQPQAAAAWRHRAAAAARLGRLEEAVMACERELALDAGTGARWAEYGHLLKDTGRPQEAVHALQRARSLGHDTAADHYLLAALGAAAPPPQAPQAYVRQLFDAYAADFDRHLCESLQYAAPTALVRWLAGSGRRWASALDLGCGTGLCGPGLRPLVDRLNGVDLSPGMLAQARARACYDNLDCDELVQHLQRTTHRHDLIVAADVFIYIGDLAPVFAAVQRVLQPGGCFVFSVERAEGETADTAWTLGPGARYAHALPALQRWAREQGWQTPWCEAGTLRLDQGRAVAGTYLGLLKPAA